MEKFAKYLDYCRAHEDMPESVLDRAAVRREDKIIKKIQKEGLRLIDEGEPFETLLDSDNDYVQFWCAMNCVERKHHTEQTIRVLRVVAKSFKAPQFAQTHDFSLSNRAWLTIQMFDDGTLYELIEEFEENPE